MNLDQAFDIADKVFNSDHWMLSFGEFQTTKERQRKHLVSLLLDAYASGMKHALGFEHPAPELRTEIDALQSAAKTIRREMSTPKRKRRNWKQEMGLR